MDISEIKQRLELALRPVKKPPTIEEALEQVSTHGVLRGPVDWVFPAWIAYVEYAAERIAETFQLSEEERRTLLNFRDTVKRLLLEAQRQAKEKLTSIYKAVVDGTYRIEGNKLYAPDGTWMYVGRTVMHIPIHGISAETYFPDVLKLPQEKLELFQLGWRASDESELDGRPFMSTTQPWQVFAWTAARHGELYIRIDTVFLTREGVSVSVHITARSWRQRWSKDEAIDLVRNHFERGEWAPLLATWLGDGNARWKEVLRGKYVLTIVAKEPWRLSTKTSKYVALVATGREAFVKLKESAGAYGELLDLLSAHKWVVVKLATDDGFRAAYKLKIEKKRSIDVLRETYRRNNGEAPTEQLPETERQRGDAVIVAGVVMYLELVSGRGGSLYARRRIKNLGYALAIAERLESAGLRPNIVKSGPNYVVYITIADLLRLAEMDGEIRRAIALYLAEKAKNGTPKQRKIAEKILKRHPFFNPSTFFCFFKVAIAVS